MTKEIKLKKPIISKDEITIDCNHTEELAMMKINTKDQKGLFSYIAKMFDDYGVEINSAKIQSLRGKAKVTCQWTMYCIVHNIEKLWRYGNMAPGIA